MAVVEVRFKVGDAARFPVNPTNTGFDGMVESIASLGYAWGPTAINAYLTGGTTPPNWNAISEWERQNIKRGFDMVNYLTQPGRTPQQVADIRDPGWESLPPGDQTNLLAGYQKMIGQAEGTLFRWQNYGHDTNWSFGQLTHFGVLLMELTDSQLLRYYAQVTQRPLVPGGHAVARMQFTSKKWWRVKYETVPEFDATHLANLADEAILVPVPRAMTPVLPGPMLETI